MDAQPARTANCHLRAFGEALQINRVDALSSVLGGRVECSSVPFSPAFDAWESVTRYAFERTQESFENVRNHIGEIRNVER